MGTGARGITGAALLLVLAATLSAQKSGQKNGNDAKAPEPQRPKLSLRAQPAIAIAPARVVLTAELTGGSDDFQEYYCPTVRWEWGDLSSSESALDCSPYEEGKTQIKRRFTIEHRFEHAGSFKVFFRLKHGSKEVAAISTMIKLQPGGAPDSDP